MFANIPTPSVIDQELIDKTPDRDLIWVILEYIAKEYKESKKTDNFFSHLPKGFELVSYTLNVLNAQISNGGFNQLFYNGHEINIPKFLEFLSTLKADKHIVILQKAVTIYKQEKQNLELQKLYSSKTLEAFSASYELTHLNDLDDEWSNIEEDLFDSIAHYIRENPELFVTKQ
jgi:hypothetical protein